MHYGLQDTIEYQNEIPKTTLTTAKKFYQLNI